jgi:hypothetical protein
MLDTYTNKHTYTHLHSNTQLYTHAQAHAHTPTHTTGADDFTPVLIYVTIKAAPDAMASNLAFIERFRLASHLVSEVSYMFVQMVSFIPVVCLKYPTNLCA